MDKFTDNGRLTPIEFIKRMHDIKRAEILDNMTDEIEWSEDTIPSQVGLHPVLADANGQLWVIMRDGDQLKLRRLSQ